MRPSPRPVTLPTARRASRLAILPFLERRRARLIGTYALASLDAHIAGSERVEECSWAIVMCAEFTR